MILLSKRAEYGLMALLHLAGAAALGRPVSSASIAARHRIPAALLGKVLQDLMRGGLVVSTAGAGGGYRLRQAPARVTLGSVIAAVDGPIRLAGCAAGCACDQRTTCSIRKPLAHVSGAVTAPFERITLVDLGAGRHEPKKSKARR
jgi:Rrf2 family protein